MLKTEYILPLAIIIAGLVIAASIYISSTYEYRKAHEACKWEYLQDKSVKPSYMDTEPLWKEFLLPSCAFDKKSGK